MKSFAIIGLGLFGTQLAKELYDEGNTVLAIDSNEESVEAIANSVTRAVTVDAQKRSALAQLGIERYDCVVVATTCNLATPVLITMNLQALGVKQIICKVQSETEREVMEKLGASYCIIPEQIGATKLSKKLTHNNIIDFTKLSEDHSILEVHVPSAWFGHSVKELNVRAKYGVNIIALRDNGDMHVNFDPEKPLDENDELIIIGSDKNLEVIQKLK